MEILMVDVLFIEKYWNRDISMLPSLLELRQYKSDSIQRQAFSLTKKSGNFKIGFFLDWMEFFSYVLC